MSAYDFLWGEMRRHNERENPEMMKMGNAYNRFGFDIFKNLYADSNNCISPASIGFALGIAYNGAKGQTKKEIERALYLEDIGLEKTNKGSCSILEKLKSADPKIELDIANSLWGNKNFKFKPDFLKRNEKNYKAELRSRDFAKSSTAKEINECVSEKTHRKINHVIDCTYDTDVIIAISTAYFRGEWTSKFKEKNTETKPFYLLDETETDCQLMHKHKGKYNYFEDKDLQAVAIPYGMGKIEMRIFLPKEKAGLKNLLNEFDLKKYSDVSSSFEEAEARILGIPRFKYDFKAGLNESLEALGIKTAFGSEADFSGIAKSGLPIYISNALHKTCIEVNEEGTEAAAATAICFSAGCTGYNEVKKFEFIADHPFFYTIHDKETDLILFMGAVNNP